MENNSGAALLIYYFSFYKTHTVGSVIYFFALYKEFTSINPASLISFLFATTGGYKNCGIVCVCVCVCKQSRSISDSQARALLWP